MSTKTTFGIADLDTKFGALTLGQFIASWRTSEGLSQKQFAKKIGISAANLCDIEKGRKGVSIYKATSIAKKIRYSPTILVQLALQEQVESLGLNFLVHVKDKVAKV